PRCPLTVFSSQPYAPIETTYLVAPLTSPRRWTSRRPQPPPAGISIRRHTTLHAASHATIGPPPHHRHITLPLPLASPTRICGNTPRGPVPHHPLAHEEEP